MFKNDAKLSDVKSRMFAVVAALFTACALAITFVAPAMAATIVGSIDDLEPGTIDADAMGSLTISVAGVNPYDDEPQDELPRGGVQGFTFTAQRIADVDLSTAQGWTRAQDYTVRSASDAGYSNVFSATTDAQGIATFDAIPVGLYFVTVTVPNDNEHSYKKPQDMLLTVPVGQLTEDSAMWQYDVTINAKYAPENPSIIPPFPIPIPIPGGNDRDGGVLSKTPTATPEPGSPNGDVESKTPEGGVLDKQLAETGASVIWMAAIAVLLILTGFVLLAKKRRDDSNEVRP